MVIRERSHMRNVEIEGGGFGFDVGLIGKTKEFSKVKRHVISLRELI
jgi:acid stress-induced BolA-like protein IbaG/YrbA